MSDFVFLIITFFTVYLDKIFQKRGVRSEEFYDFDEIEEEARERTSARTTSNKLKRLKQKIREGMVEAAATRRAPRPLVKALDKSKTPEVQYRCFNVSSRNVPVSYNNKKKIESQCFLCKLYTLSFFTITTLKTRKSGNSL